MIIKLILSMEALLCLPVHMLASAVLLLRADPFARFTSRSVVHVSP